MKSTPYVLIFLLLSVPLVAQRVSNTFEGDTTAFFKKEKVFSKNLNNFVYLPDSTINTSVDGGEITLYKKEYTHDFNENLIETILFRQSYIIFNGWDNVQRTTTEHNNTNAPIQILENQYNESSQMWENVRKYEFFYDNTNNTMHRIHSYWKMSSHTWILEQKRLYQYNNSDNPLTQYVWNWDPDLGEWKMNYAFEYIYNSEDLLVEFYSHDWLESTQTWNPSRKIEFIYNSDSILILKEYYHWDFTNESWYYVFEDEYFYNTNGELIKKILGGVFYTFKNDYTYYSNGLLKQELNSKWNNSTQSWDDWHDRYIWFYSLHEVAKLPENNISTFTLFPNPTDNFIQFRTESSLQKIQVSIFDIHGKKLLKETLLVDKKLNVGSLKTGMYIYKIQCETSVQTGKFVVKR